MSNAFTAQNVAPSAKHFPGHGNTHVDSHLSLPRILVDRASLSATELVPFQALVRDGIASIMTGHMALPLVTGDDTPCSLSRAITTDLLRGEMGYKGVVVTDCLEMKAISDPAYGPGVERGAVLALRAGADIVMICHTFDWHVGSVKATYAALESGELSMDDLRASGERITKLKRKYAGDWGSNTSTDEGEIENQWKALKEDGKMLLSMEELENINLHCLYHRLDTLLGGVSSSRNIVLTS